MSFSEAKAREVIEEVLNRLKKSSDKYKDAYVVNNMTKELNDEFFDIIGWPLMMVLRMKEAMEKTIYDFDNIYWDKFLENQETDFLGKMQLMVTQELAKRNLKAIEELEDQNEKIQEEIEKDAKV